MTIFLYSLLTAGADKMMQTDPHGWTLTIISVLVVFMALVILYFLYSLSGNIFSGKYKKKAGKAAPVQDEAIAAAIALALDAELGSDDETAAAIGVWLYLQDAVHDYEPGFITIKPQDGKWADRTVNFRHSPR